MPKKTKLLLGIVGTIFLGALGSGLWEICFRSLFTWIGRSILGVITFGVSSIQDSIYAEIAKGHTDRAVLYFFPFAFLALGTFMGFVFAKRPRSTAPDAISDRNRRIGWWNMFIILSVMTFNFMFRSVTINYESGAVDHFEQSLSVCLPYMSSLERDQVRSQFAQIHTKADYVSVLGKLESIATDNHIHFPTFSVL